MALQNKYLEFVGCEILLFLHFIDRQAQIQIGIARLADRQKTLVSWCTPQTPVTAAPGPHRSREPVMEGRNSSASVITTAFLVHISSLLEELLTLYCNIHEFLYELLKISVCHITENILKIYVTWTKIKCSELH